MREVRRNSSLFRGAVLLISSLLFQTPVFVHLRMEWDSFHEERGNEASACNAYHNLPDDGNTLSERLLNLTTEGLLEFRYGGNHGVRQGYASRKLGEEVLWKSFAELSLQYRGSNRDTPDLQDRK